MMRPVLLCTLMVVAVSGSTNMLRSPRRVTAAESEQSGVSLEDLERKLQIVAFYGSPSCALADKKNDQYFDGTLLRFILLISGSFPVVACFFLNSQDSLRIAFVSHRQHLQARGREQDQGMRQ